LPNQQSMGNKCGSSPVQQAEDVDVPEEQMVTIFVKKAQGLTLPELLPETDRFLFFTAEVGGLERYSSQQKKNVLDPVWNEEFEVPFSGPMTLSVFQADADGSATVIASATLDLVAADADAFNGELPLEADGRPTGAVLLLKARSGDLYPPDQGSEFTVTMDNTKKKALGLEVDSTDPSNLFVVGVKKGTITDNYNKEAQPDNKLEAGCFITGVTAPDAAAKGCIGGGTGNPTATGESKAMEKMIKKNPKKVDLVCRRGTQFRVALTVTDKGDIGVEVPKKAAGNSLVVNQVKANGPVEAWNADNPDQLVEAGDRIVAIDGKAGKVADLQKLLKHVDKSARVTLTLARIAPQA